MLSQNCAWLQVGCSGESAADKAAHERCLLHSLDPAGAFDLSTWLNWYMFYQGSEGVRNSFLDMWEYLAGNTFCTAQTSWHRTRTFTLLQGAACGTGELPLCPLHACAHALR